MLMKRWRALMAFGLFWMVAVSSSQIAHGYLLPPQQIIEFVTKQTARVYNFRLDVWAESPDPTYPEAMIKREMIYYAARPNLLRRETVGEAESGTILVSSGRRLSLIDGHVLEEPPRHEEIFPILLFASAPEFLEALLKTEQVNFSEVHLGRMEKHIAYVIGGPPGKPEAPQCWCDKDSFWPLRLVGLRSYQGIIDLVDIRFLSYRQVAESIWLPSVVEFYRQDKLFLRLTVQRTHHNERFPAALFDLESFAAKYLPLKEPPEKPAEGLEEMRRYLEKKYE